MTMINTAAVIKNEPIDDSDDTDEEHGLEVEAKRSRCQDENDIIKKEISLDGAVLEGDDCSENAADIVKAELYFDGVTMEEDESTEEDGDEYQKTNENDPLENSAKLENRNLSQEGMSILQTKYDALQKYDERQTGNRQMLLTKNERVKKRKLDKFATDVRAQSVFDMMNNADAFLKASQQSNGSGKGKKAQFLSFLSSRLEDIEDEDFGQLELDILRLVNNVAQKQTKAKNANITNKNANEHVSATFHDDWSGMSLSVDNDMVVQGNELFSELRNCM